MAEKILNTRIQLKYDTLANWMKLDVPGKYGNLILKKGEVGICEIPSGNNTATTAPTVLLKVGDGNLPFHSQDGNCLKWMSALAADVHAWAKKSLDEFTDWVAKTPKTVTLKVNNEDTDYTIEEAIKLVRNEITAGGEAAAITIADESIDGQVKYTAKQGGADIVESIVINEGEGVEITVDDNEPKISHQAKPTTGTAENSTAGTGRTYVTKVLVDSLGHIAGVETATETDQEIPDSPAIEIINKTKTDDEDTAYVVSNLEESGTLKHTITPTYKAVPTKKYVDEQIAEKVAGAVQYLGTVSALTDLAETAGKGDFYRVAVEIKSGDTVLAHAGDLLVAEKDKPAQQIDNTNWSVIHGEEGDITEIVADDGLTGGGSTGSVTVGLNQDSKDALALARTALQSKDISGKADKVTGATAGNFAGLDTNGNLTDSGKKAADFATADQGGKADTALQAITAGDGLKVSVKSDNTRQIDFDDAVTFIFNCGDAAGNPLN